MNIDKDIDELSEIINVKSQILTNIKQLKIIYDHRDKEVSRRSVYFTFYN